MFVSIVFIFITTFNNEKYNNKIIQSIQRVSKTDFKNRNVFEH